MTDSSISALISLSGIVLVAIVGMIVAYRDDHPKKR